MKSFTRTIAVPVHAEVLAEANLCVVEYTRALIIFRSDTLSQIRGGNAVHVKDDIYQNYNIVYFKTKNNIIYGYERNKG